MSTATIRERKVRGLRNRVESLMQENSRLRQKLGEEGRGGEEKEWRKKDYSTEGFMTIVEEVMSDLEGALSTTEELGESGPPQAFLREIHEKLVRAYRKVEDSSPTIRERDREGGFGQYGRKVQKLNRLREAILRARDMAAAMV